MTAGRQVVSSPLAFRPAFLLLGAILLAVLFAHRTPIPNDPGQAMVENRGYMAAANALAQHGCLRIKPLPQGEGRLTIERAPVPPPGCPPQDVFDAYRAQSFLGGDMAGLVSQRWLFASTDNPQPTGIRANAHVIRFAGGPQTSWAGSVLYADGAVTGPPQRLWFDGRTVKAAPPSCPDMLVDGEPAKGPVALYQYAQCAGTAWQNVEAVQQISETTGSAARVREPSLASVARRLEVPGTSSNIVSTVQRALHFRTEQILRAHLCKADTTGKIEKTIRAGVLLMDGKTGEIAAAATHPLQADEVGSDHKDNWLTRNWNFERMPIGSTAKMPFAAAITQASPALLDRRSPLRVSADFCPRAREGDACRRRAQSELGTTFRDFIAFSSNGHALWLLDQARHADVAAWQQNLRRFACIEPLEGNGDPSCSGFLWRSDRAGAGLAQRGTAEPVLALDMDHLNGETLFAAYYLDILGGNRSSWTSTNLAQAYARIFTDTTVNPRLTPADGPPPPALGIDPRVWQAIRDGMAGALERGTAKALCSAIGCTGDTLATRHRLGRLWLYAKTGTPTITGGGDDGENSDGDDAKLLVLLAATTRTGAEPQRPSDISGLKLVVITQRYNKPGRAALDLAASLFRDARFRSWIGLDAAPDAGGPVMPETCR